MFRFRLQDRRRRQRGRGLPRRHRHQERSTGTVTDGAESGDNGWTADGWQRLDRHRDDHRGALLPHREPSARRLRHHPAARVRYNFSKGLTQAQLGGVLPVPDGMLVWYVDDAYADNNVTAHPGGGSALPVDAVPAPFAYSDGTRAEQPAPAVRRDLRPAAVRRGPASTRRSSAARTRRQEPSGVRRPTCGDGDVRRHRPAAYSSRPPRRTRSRSAGAGVKATVTGRTAAVPHRRRQQPGPEPGRTHDTARLARHSRGPASRGAPASSPGPLPASRLRAHRTCGRKHT